MLFWCLFTLLLHNSGNKHQNNPLVSTKTVCHSSTYIILHIYFAHYLITTKNNCTSISCPHRPLPPLPPPRFSSFSPPQQWHDSIIISITHTYTKELQHLMLWNSNCNFIKVSGTYLLRLTHWCTHLKQETMEWRKETQGSTPSFLAGCPNSHFLGWYRNFLVYWYLKLDNQVVNSTCPTDKLGWIWRVDDP